MCVAFFALGQHKDYPLIIASNRDEFYERPTREVRLWGTPPVISGLDLKAGGTWLAVSASSKFALVTNFRGAQRPRDSVLAPPGLAEPLSGAPLTETLSRGELPLLFVQAEVTPQRFINQLNTIRDSYNPFSIVFGDSKRISFYSSPTGESGSSTGGLVGLSNAAPDVLWPKVARGKQALQNALKHVKKSALVAELFTILSSKVRALPGELPITGISQGREEFLSSIFIASKTYGTRASSVVLCSLDGRVSFFERRFGPEGELLGESEIRPIA